jgi:hypothetical protein
VLVSNTRDVEDDQDIVNAEWQELGVRIDRRIENQLLDPSMIRRFRRRLRGSRRAVDKPIETNTGYGPLILSAAQVEALRICHDAVEALRSGGVRQSMGELMANGDEAQVRASGDDGTSNQILYYADSLSYLFELALILGIDTYCYPALHRAHQRYQTLREFAGKGFTSRVHSTYERAQWYAERILARRPEQREFLDLVRVLDRLDKLAGLELVPEEYDELVAEFEDYTLARLLKYLGYVGNTQSPGGQWNVRHVAGKGSVMPDDIAMKVAEFDDRREYFLSFYDLARRRARHMAMRTIELAAEKDGRALLICLGFLQPTVRESWLARGASFVFLKPSIDFLPKA